MQITCAAFVMPNTGTWSTPYNISQSEGSIPTDPNRKLPKAFKPFPHYIFYLQINSLHSTCRMKCRGQCTILSQMQVLQIQCLFFI